MLFTFSRAIALLLQWRAAYLPTFLVVLFGFSFLTFSDIASAQPKKSLHEAPEQALSVDQTLTVTGDAIVVWLQFENRSVSSVLVKEGIFGVAVRGLPVKVHELAENEFLLYAGANEVDYIGPIVLQEPLTKADFTELQPSQKSVRQVDIRKGFRFLRGRHQYALVHRHLELDRKTGRYQERRSVPVKFEFEAP